MGPWELPYNQYLTTADLYGRCARMHACCVLSPMSILHKRAETSAYFLLDVRRYAGPGNTYVLVGTLQHGVNGELRGQLTDLDIVPAFSPAVLPPEELPTGMR